MLRTIFTTISTMLLFAGSLMGQSFWKAIPPTELATDARLDRAEELPTKFQAYQLDFDRLSDYLEAAPMEFTAAAKTNALRLDIPMPDGKLVPFEIIESQIMEDRLAARYPNIRSFSGKPLTKDATRIRFVMSYRGFYGVISTPQGQIYIDPYTPNELGQAIAYYTKDELSSHAHSAAKTCGFENDEEVAAEIAARDWHPSMEASQRSLNMDPINLKIFRLAIGTTGEWTQAHANGEVDQAMEVIAITVTRMNMVFEREFAFRMVLNQFQDEVIHTNPGTDPYSNANNGGALLGQNTEVLNSIIGSGNYDFGHVYTGGCTDVGGIANLGSFCGENKGGGVSCHGGNPTGWGPISIIMHEMGHQLGGAHTFNNCNAGASGNGHEPGSGSTILSYGGLCGSNNVETVRDDYYNIGNVQQIFNFLNNGTDGCFTINETSNHYPEVEIPIQDGFYIPISTPFEMTAIGQDIDDDDITFCWEQYNLGPASPLGFPMEDAPSFRSFYPAETGHRSFPELLDILTNVTTDRTEVLATYSRNFNFRCTVRDFNEEAGGTTWDEVAFKATADAGPFLVVYPNEFTTIEGGAQTEVTWDVANTDQAPVNCQSVDILLSIDGGFTFTDTLAKSVFNDGSHMVYFPSISVTQARIKIKASESIFFDLSNRPFQIIPASAPGYTIDLNTYYKNHCNPGIATFEVGSSSIQNYNSPIELSTGPLPPNVIATFSNNPIMPGESSTLSIDLRNSNLDETTMIEAIATSISDTTTHELFINIINSDFTAIVGQTPLNGEDGINGTPEFTWGSTINAETYDLEVSYDPGFNELIYGEYEMLGSSFTPPSIFDKTSTVYWRIRGVNECGPGQWQYSAFQTESFRCTFFNNESLALPINKAVGTTVESILFVADNGSIEDLDVNRLNLDFAPIGGLDIRLKGPDQTEVILMTDDCANTGEVRITFNDEANNPIVCPPNSYLPFTPKEPLSAFDGKDIGGEWVLRIEVLESGFIAGRLNSWNLETCAGFTAKNPTLLTNKVLPVRTGDAQVITKDYLEVTDADNTSTELQFNLVSLPEHGTLSAYGSDLEEGDNFLQDFIYDFGVRYTHNGNDAVEDAFYFTVTDGNGGLLGVTKFIIDIDPNNQPVSTNTPVLVNEIRLVPNPANTLVDIQLTQALQERAQLTLYDLSGRQLSSIVLPEGSRGQTLNLDAYADGLYIVQLRSGQQMLNKKLIIVR